VPVPEEADRELVDSVIFNELCLGRFNEASKDKFRGVINKLAKRGAQGVILGCTEIPLLINQSDTKPPLFDTTKIHAKAAVDFALKETKD
jgi:aspartate racemase